MSEDMFDNAATPLSSSPMSASEKERLLGLMEPLLKFLGCPGDWGYGTKLGDTTIRLLALHREVRLFQPGGEG